MLAYMNKESLKRHLRQDIPGFIAVPDRNSGIKVQLQVICKKSQISNQTAMMIRFLVTVIQTGAACHTGNHSCFFTDIWKEGGERNQTFLMITGKVLLAPFLFCLFWISRIFELFLKISRPIVTILCAIGSVGITIGAIIHIFFYLQGRGISVWGIVLSVFLQQP